tara:strand:+ start:120 stop:389 length:270 start_codon:yes stop_codon:yes gene_type:complete
MEIIGTILVVVLVVVFFIVRNLLKTIEKLEDIQIEYENFITKQSEAINVCGERLTQIDKRGIFKSDDEIGWFWEEIKKIQEALNEFTIK